MSQKSLRIAIVGGGLAGATLMYALLQHSHLDVHIFESAAAFKEAGAAVGIARNALSALDLIGATACLQRAGAVPQKGVCFMLAQGPDAGESGVMIGEINAEDEKHLVSIVHRAAFLKELLADVPLDRMHISKKLESVDFENDDEKPGKPITLHFTDKTTHECDILVGADGIQSTVRRIILGEDPAVPPRNTGMWAVRALKSYSTAQAILGKGLVDIENARQHSWIGDGAWIMHDVLSEGQLVQFVACAMHEEAQGSDQWRTTVSADEIRRTFRDWPVHLKNATEELLCDQSEQPALYLWDHPSARTYVSGPLCVMGDAAHATTPWKGSGAGMAIEDSLVLSTLLGYAKSSSQAILALKAYDHVRRPRTQSIVEASRETGIMSIGRGKETGLDLQQFRKILLPSWDFIIDFDNKKHCEEALAVMNRLIDGDKV